MTHDLPVDWVGSSLDDFQLILGDNQQRGICTTLEKYLPDASSACWMIRSQPMSSARLPSSK